MKPFDYKITKDSRLLIYRGGALIMTLGGARAAKLIAQLGESEEADQQLLARATGNYKHGNERESQKTAKHQSKKRNH